MARIAVIADIHGNLEALEAVLEDIDKQKNISKVYSLGDNVGYGASPVAVLEVLQERGIRSLIGNHEAAIMGILDFEEEFNSRNAVKATYWTVELLKEHGVDVEQSPFFNGAGFSMSPSKAPRAVMTHSTLTNPEAFDYIVRPEIAETRQLALKEFRHMKRKGIPLAFFGHSHEAVIVRCDYGFATIEIAVPNFIKKKRSYTYRLTKEEMWMVNVGSVGQPRDGDPRACYLVYDTSRNTVTYYRIEYDVDTAFNKIMEAGLPEVYAVRLRAGR